MPIVKFDNAYKLLCLPVRIMGKIIAFSVCIHEEETCSYSFLVSLVGLYTVYPSDCIYCVKPSKEEAMLENTLQALDYF